MKKNTTKFKFFKNRNFFLIVDRGINKSNDILCQFGIKINKKKKLNSFILTDRSNNKETINYFKSFGCQNIISLNTYKSYFLNFFTVLFSIQKIFYILLIKKKGVDWIINNFKVDGIKIGDIIYDTHIRHNHEFINPKINFKFIKIIFFATYRCRAINNLVNKYKIKFIIAGTFTYSHNDGIAVKVGVKNKIKVFLPAVGNYSGNRMIELNMNKLNYGIFSIKKNNEIKNVLRVNLSSKSLEKFLIDRIEGKVSLNYTAKIDLYLANKKGIKKNGNHLLNKLILNKKKHVVLFAAHAFSDATRGLGYNFLFRDYYAQVKETLDFIDRNYTSQVLWIIKKHPNDRYKEKNILENLVKKYNKENFKICPDSVGTNNLLKICDTVVTGRGTIGMEAAIKGKPVILAGPASYSNLGITYDPKTKNEYFNLINKVRVLKSLSKNKIILAKKILYYLETSYSKTVIL